MGRSAELPLPRSPTSTMRRQEPHAVASRAWIIVEATHAPDGLNDITGFDVQLVE